MNATEIQRAVTAVTEIATALGLPAGETAVLHNSNKLALRLLPCDVFARVAHAGREVAQFEVDLAQQLALSASPVAELAPGAEPRVYERDGFAVTFWSCYQPLPNELKPGDYANALARLHAGMRNVELPSPHFSDRVAEAQEIVANPAVSPALPAADREILLRALRDLRSSITGRGAPEQLLHGEPHPGNVLSTASGPRFIDLETCCRGPIEFDLAHVPGEVSDRYPDIDQELLRECRVLVHAMVAAWRWDRDDEYPDGLQMGRELLAQVRRMLES